MDSHLNTNQKRVANQIYNLSISFYQKVVLIWFFLKPLVVISNIFCFISFPHLLINIICFGLTKNGRQNRSSGAKTVYLRQADATKLSTQGYTRTIGGRRGPSNVVVKGLFNWTLKYALKLEGCSFFYIYTFSLNLRELTCLRVVFRMRLPCVVATLVQSHQDSWYKLIWCQQRDILIG